MFDNASIVVVGKFHHTLMEKIGNEKLFLIVIVIYNFPVLEEPKLIIMLKGIE